MRKIKDLTFFEKRLLICIKNGWYKKFNSLRKDIFDFSNIDFSKIAIKLNLKKFNFHGSYFNGSNFSGSNFSWSDFRGSDFRWSDFHRSDFHRSNFRGSNFSGSNFSGSNFSGSNFSWSDFRGSDFHRSNFRGSDFSRSNFSRSNFRESDFSEVNFSCQKGLSVISISGIGSDNRMTIYFYRQNKIFCGCFNGTLEEFKKKLEKTYTPEELYYQQYSIVIEYFKSQKKLINKKESIND